MFTVFTLIPWEPDKETEHNMTPYKELLGTWRQILKSSIYLQYLQNHLVKILQTNCFAKFDSSACQGILFRHVQLLSPSIKISKN